MPTITNTLNWDTVFAIPIKEVNDAIIAHKTSPLQFSYSTPKGDSIQGEFEDWQVVQGGGDSLLRMAIPVKAVSGETYGEKFEWKQGQLIIEIHLAFFPHTEKVDFFNLKVRSSSSNPENPVLSLESTDYSQAITGEAVDTFGAEMMNSLVSTLIVNWLNEHLEDFDHIFATININEKIDKDAQWAWCKPSYIDYAYGEGATLDSSVLGVLCMTGGRKAGDSQLQQIDPFVIPTGSVAGFLVSPKRFLEDLMKPTLEFKWTNSREEDYEVISDADTQTGKYQHVLRLKEGRRIRLKDKKHDGTVYTPYMTKMSVTNMEDQLVFETYSETDVGMGITAWCKTVHWYSIVLGKNKNGQTLQYKEVKKPVVEHGTKADSGTEILRIFIILAGILATVILGFITEGAAFAVGAVIIGCLMGVAAATPDIVEAVNNDTAPDISLLTFNTTNPIQWAAQNVFTLTSAQLNNSLQLGGQPHFNFR